MKRLTCILLLGAAMNVHAQDVPSELKTELTQPPQPVEAQELMPGESREPRTPGVEPLASGLPPSPDDPEGRAKVEREMNKAESKP